MHTNQKYNEKSGIYLSIDGCVNQSISYYLMIGDNLLFNLIYCHSMNRQESTH